MPFQDSYVLWKIIGYSGLAMFQSRWVVQWLHSERKGESHMPTSFWWLSLAGATLCLAYALRQQDSVFIAGYALTVVPIGRNLVLIRRKKMREQNGQTSNMDIAVDSGAEPEMAKRS